MREKLSILIVIVLICIGCNGRLFLKSDPSGSEGSHSPPGNTPSLDKSREQTSNSKANPRLLKQKPHYSVQSRDGRLTIEREDKIQNEQNPLDAALDFYQNSQELWSRGEFDHAISALDEAYSLILDVKSEDPVILEQKEDLRILISRRLIEIHASRYTSVDGKYNAIPLTMNKYVRDEIHHFQTVDRDFFISSYRRSKRYIDQIMKEMSQAGLPQELAWLPLVESGFTVNAFSRARALGLWQFIASTGSKFGLKRDNWIDERLDPEKSTRAAIAYLQELHLMFGDWTTVLASYNCGDGNVLRVIRGQKINYLDNFWDLYERLPRETARYVPRFLATLHIVKNPAQYGFNLRDTDEPLSFDVVTVKKQVRLDAIANKLGISQNLLSDLNPELRIRVTPPHSYSLRVPAGTSAILLASVDGIPEWSNEKHYQPCSNHLYHRVTKGETLSSIAKKYKTSVLALSKANHIKDNQSIKTGQRIKIP